MSRRPTMVDVAAHAGVSRALVSVVFRGAEGASQETRERVFRAAAELGYQPDTAARMLRRQRSGFLGVVYAARNPFHADLVEAVYPAAEQRGYSVVLSAVTAARDEREAVRDLLGFRSEALIVIGQQSLSQELAPLVAGTPVVTVGTRLAGTAFDSVRTNDAQGIHQAVDHLVELGHRAIAHVDGGSMLGAAERRRGYRAAMRRHGLQEEIAVLPGDYSEDSGVRAGHELLRREVLPTAVIAGNDWCAVGLLDALLRLGVEVPRELSVVGYDDSQLARLSHVNLTTVRQDAGQTAGSAIQTLVERLEEGRTEVKDVVLRPELVVRGTTGPPRIPS